MSVTTEPGGGSGRTWAGLRRRGPALLAVLACVAALVSAVTGAANPVNALEFLSPGHWVYNVVYGSVFHIDGATARVDASIPIEGHPGASQVVEGDTSGFVVSDSSITEFDKASMEAAGGQDRQERGVMVPLEVAGVVYMVFKEAGVVTRFGGDGGDRVLRLSGPLGDPVATSDGTLWVPRAGTGLLCRVSETSSGASCPVELPEGSSGALTLVGDRAAFLDTARDRLYPVEADGLGTPRELGVDLPDGVRLAGTDVEGRVAVLEPGGPAMTLVDAAGLDPARTPADPVRIVLGDGDWDGPISTGEAVAVLDRVDDTVTTYAPDGRRLKQERLPDESGDARLVRGQDNRVYVDSGQGGHVLVVDRDGSIARVTINPRQDSGADAPAGPEEPDDSDAQAAPPPPPAAPDQGPRLDGPPRRDIPGQTDPDPDTTDRPPAGPPPAGPPTGTPTSPVVPRPLPPTPPGAPPAVTAVAGDASATVTWGEAAANRSPVTGYTVRWATGSRTVAGDERTFTAGGLVNGTPYVFTVSATNAVGTGAGAASAPVTPAAPAVPPTAPTGLTVDYDRDAGTAQLSWNEPDLGGNPLARYVVTATGAQQRTTDQPAAALTGIPDDGEAVTFTVRADTRAPDGSLLEGATATHVEEAPQAPGGVPPAPTGLTVDYDRAAGTARVSWDEVDLGGNSLVHYVVEATGAPPGYVNQGQGFSTTLRNIPNTGGAVIFEVRADSRTSDGTILHGAKATYTAPAPGGGGPRDLPPGATFTLGRGRPTTEHCDDPGPDCAYMAISFTGLEPGAEYKLEPYSTHEDYQNDGATVRANASGSYQTESLFAFEIVGAQVWITMTAPDGAVYTSNRLTWEAGS